MSGTHTSLQEIGTCLLTVAAIVGLLVMSTPWSQAQTLTVLYNFTGGADGGWPFAGLAVDAQGNLYGTTFIGGDTNCNRVQGCGVVFKVTPNGTETVLHTFAGGTDGEFPLSRLALDEQGNMYGTTEAGDFYETGTLFELDPYGQETLLYTFNPQTDGTSPLAGLVRDEEGNLYGTTSLGGYPGGGGTVFQVTPGGAETTLYSFDGSKKSQGPYGPASGLVRDAQGNLYGTTPYGGSRECKPLGRHGCGTVFEVAADGTEKVLHDFTKSQGDGYAPVADLVLDAKGNLFGTTSEGGISPGNKGRGTVFEVLADGTEKVLHAFTGKQDGCYPYAGLVMDSQGNLYGTTSACGIHGAGTVFETTPDGTEKVLYSFNKKHTGSTSRGDLILDGQGNLYGTTELGGLYGFGTVFKLTP